MRTSSDFTFNARIRKEKTKLDNAYNKYCAILNGAANTMHFTGFRPRFNSSWNMSSFVPLNASTSSKCQSYSTATVGRTNAIVQAVEVS